MKRSSRVMLGLACGIVITLPALLLAVASAGAGHGDYVLARVLFPYTVLLARLAGDTITAPLIGIALSQFPAYGLACALYRPGVWATGAAALAAAHAAAAIACFSGFLPNFS